MAADKALAEQANLKLSDFPTGWTATPQSNDSATPSVDKQLAACLHTTVAFLEQSSKADVKSPNFDDANGDEVSSEVDYEATKAPIDHGFATLGEPQASSCLQTAVNGYLSYQLQHPSKPSDSLPPGVSIGTSTVAPMSFPPYGDRSLAYRMTVPVTASSIGLQVTAYLDIVFVQKGRAACVLTFTGVNSPLDSSMEQQLASLTESRLTGT